MSLPVSMSALRTLVAVAATGSMAKAAARLGVTPGAVSQALRQLEASLLVELVRPDGRGIALTADGRALFEAIGPSFDRIEHAMANFVAARRVKKRQRRRVLRITTTPSLATTWLVPRLGALSAVYPGWQIEVDASVGLSDLAASNLTVAVRHGAGRYPGHVVKRLYRPFLLAVARADIAKAAGSDPSRWARMPLLHDREWLHWARFAKHADLDPVASARTPGPAFENDLLLIEAAASGAGLALVRDIYAAQAIASGRIVPVGSLRIPTDTAYYFVAAPSRAHAATIASLQKWFATEMG